MLTTVQKKLLILLKEIDELCTENNIEYYLGGGCLLGAVRSGGFLPWDDDADIHMTRENAFKFLALEDKLPANRIIYRGDLKDGMSPFQWRYVDTDTCFTTMHSTVAGTPEGILVDIFILDPVNCEDNNNIKRDFFLYLQYRNRFRFVWKYPDEILLQEYKKLREREKTEGYNSIIKAMEKKLWSEKDGDDYLIRCFNGHIMPKDIWGAPQRKKFEDIYINIPERVEEVLSLGYGCRWMDEPLINERQIHGNIADADVSFTVYGKTAVQLKKHSKKNKKLFSDILASYIEMFSSQRAEHKKNLHLQAILFIKKTERFLKAEKTNISKLVASRDTDGLDTVFSDFYDLQFSTGNKWDVYMDIPEEYLYAAVHPLLYNGEFEKTGDLIKRYMNYDASYKTERLQKIKELCDDTITITNLIYADKDLKAARKLAEKYLPEWSWTLFMARIDALLCLNEEIDAYVQKSRTLSYLEQFPRDGELMAYYGEALDRSGQRDEAAFTYKKALATLRNGLVITQITNRLKEIGKPEKSDEH